VSNDDRLDRLDAISEQLRGLYRSIESARRIVHQQRTEIVGSLVSQGLSVAAASRAADEQCVVKDCELMGFEGERRALEEERDHLRFLVKWDRD
jgi:hypothetical protein